VFGRKRRARPLPWPFSVCGKGGGDQVVSSSSDNAITRWDGTTGKKIKNSTAFVDASGNILLHALPNFFIGFGSGYADSKITCTGTGIFEFQDQLSTPNPTEVHAGTMIPNELVFDITNKDSRFMRIDTTTLQIDNNNDGAALRLSEKQNVTYLKAIRRRLLLSCQEVITQLQLM